VTTAGLLVRSAWRRPARVIGTLAGVAVAVAAFGFLRTAIRAYHAGVDAAAKERLVVRSRASLAQRLPIAHKEKIARVPGVTHVAAADWFGGVYIDKKNFFLSLAVDPDPFLKVFPEYLLSDEEKRAFLADRAGCIVGDKLARKYGWELGTRITLQGNMFPGDWTYTVRGIYRPRDPSTIATQLFFHWQLLDERVEPERHGEALAFFVGVDDPARAAEIAQAIDASFGESEIQTLSESERSFQLTFISMAGMVLDVLRAICALLLVVITLVMAGAIATSVRERTSELAVMRTLGFGRGRLAILIAAESALIAGCGGLVGVLFAEGLVRSFAAFMDKNMGSFFPIFVLEPATAYWMMGAALALGLTAALIPAWRAFRINVAQALRRA
jgi:putative ABC transport system permease protein